MASSDLRRTYLEYLMQQVSSCDFPSPGMLDRIEQAVGDRESAEAYVEALLEQVSAGRYPSPTMLDRVAGLIQQLESAHPR